MAHDVFISYSSRDAGVAESLCNALEQNGLRCWIAPRNITPGVKYAAALLDAISKCKIFLLILSAASNESPQVEMEVDRAASKNLPILCFRIDTVALSKTLEFYLSSRHWLDASKPPLEAHIHNLVQTARQLVAGGESMPSIPAVKVARLALRLVEEHPAWETPLMTVSRGKEETGGRAVLVTRIRKHLVPAGDFLARFEPLAKAIGRVEPGHLVKILDLGEQDGQAVVVQAAPAGRSLGELAGGGEGLPMDEVLDIARQLGELLAELYKRNLLQLVFEPQAVWLSDEGLVTVSNTGIPQGANIGSLLAEGTLKASPWVAPELRQDEPGDTRTDFYSLGALLHLALTGKEPDMGGSGDKTPTLADLYPSRLRLSLTPEWDDLVSRCIHPNPARRIQSVAEYMSRLEEVRSGMEMVAGETPDRQEDSLVGQTLGGYQLVEKLGQGGMATVYKAYESVLDRYVAVKVLPSFFRGDANFAQRFKREAKAVAHLNHPNIIPIYNYGEEKGTTFIAMQLMQGGTLKRPHGEVYTPQEALRMLLPVTRALAYAHQHGIVHRDIKPSNILLTEDKWPEIADFGLVQMAEVSARLTGSGVGLGTPAYMSPEQGQGGRVDQRSDIYSLGIVLYEMVTGDVPFHADTPVGVLLKHVTEPIPSAHEVNPAIPREVEAIILKAAAKDPQKRYQTAEEMAAAMEQALVRITTAGEKVVERKKVKAAPVPKKKDIGRRSAEGKPVKPLKPAWRLRPVHLIAGGAVLVLVLAGIFVPRLLSGIARSVPTTLPGLPTWTAYPGATAPPTQKAATQTAGSPSTWSKVNDLPILDRDQVNAIVIDPGDSQVVYVGTQNSGIYKSEDGGATWTPNSGGLAGSSVTTLVIDPREPQTLYAAVQARGVYRSTDGAKTWTMSQENQSGNTWPQCTNLVMDPNDPTRLYFSDGKNLFRTENGGDSWSNMSSNLTDKGVLCSLTIAAWDGSTKMWASLQDDGFYMSTDKGFTWNGWEPWNTLLPDVSTHEYDFYLDPYEDGGMYVSFRDANSSDAYLLHSQDKGTTWTINHLNCTNGMAFDPNDQVEYCATGLHLFVTKDGGGKWEVFQNLPENWLYSLAISPSGSLYLGSREVIFSADGGASWEFKKNGLGAAKYEFMVNPDDPTGLYLVQGNADDQWTLLKGGETGDFDKMGRDYPGYPSFHDGIVYISKGKELWRFTPETNQLDLVSSIDSSSIHFVADPIPEAQDTIFGTGDPNYFFRSEDGGKNWDKVEAAGASTGRLFFNSSDRGIMYSSTIDSLYISKEYGKTWEPCAEEGSTIPDSSTALAIDPRDIGIKIFRLYLASSTDLLVSTDNCKSWTGLKVPFASLNINTIVIDPDNPDTLYAGTDKGVFVSNDQGNHWTGISDGLPGEGVVYSILAREDGRVFAATPFGVYRLEGK